MPFADRFQKVSQKQWVLLGIGASALIVAILLVLRFTLFAPALYQDPNGAFSVRIPSGWKAQPQSGTPMISFVNEAKQASMTFGVMTGPTTKTPSVDDELNTVRAQFPQQCPQLMTNAQGSITLGGEPGKFVTISCGGGQDPTQTMEVAVASGPGNMIILNSSVATTNASSVESAFRSMQESFKLTGGGGASAKVHPIVIPGMGQPAGDAPASGDTTAGVQNDATTGSGAMGFGQPGNGGAPSGDNMGGGSMNSGPPNTGMPGGGAQTGDGSPLGGDGQMSSQGNTFRDPQGRYSFQVPPQWNVSSDNGNTTVSSDSASVSFLTGSGSQAGQVAGNIAQQITSQYTNAKILNQGDTQVNGHAAHGLNLTGINPKGARVSVLVISIEAAPGSGHFLTAVSIAPIEQARQVNGVVMNMVNTVQF